jgi:hypothetical protein
MEGLFPATVWQNFQDIHLSEYLCHKSAIDFVVNPYTVSGKVYIDIRLFLDGVAGQVAFVFNLIFL